MKPVPVEERSGTPGERQAAFDADVAHAAANPAAWGGVGAITLPPTPVEIAIKQLKDELRPAVEAQLKDEAEKSAVTKMSLKGSKV